MTARLLLPLDFPDRLVVRLTCADVGETNLAAVAAALFDLAERHPGRPWDLDLGPVETMTSGLLTRLLLLKRQLHAGGGALAIRNVRPAVHTVFQATRLADLLDVRAARAA